MTDFVTLPYILIGKSVHAWAEKNYSISEATQFVHMLQYELMTKMLPSPAPSRSFRLSSNFFHQSRLGDLEALRLCQAAFEDIAASSSSTSPPPQCSLHHPE